MEWDRSWGGCDDEFSFSKNSKFSVEFVSLRLV